MSTLPLIRYADTAATIAWRQGRRIDVRGFLGAAADLAERLPGCGHVVNLCTDRFDFAVGLAAALLRRQVSLLPPNDTPVMLRQLAERYPGAVCLTDPGVAYPGLECIQVPEPVRGRGVRRSRPFRKTRLLPSPSRLVRRASRCRR